jgi:hypothetical protein
MRRNQKGQAVLLVVIALGVFLFGAVGLAVDGAQMYFQREMAQAAADSAAEAGIFGVFASTVVCPNTGCVYTAHTCVAADLSKASPTQYLAPCSYASNNGFMTAADTVVVTYPSSPYNGVAGTSNPSFPQPFMQVAITRTLQTTLMHMFGSSTSSVTAVGGAGIVQTSSPVPIVVLHPNLSGALSVAGNSSITICGGPSKSIQVNSISSTAVSAGTIDLSHAGPADLNENCTLGTGADFGVFGGPTSAPGGISFGTTGHYLQPSAPMSDPFRSIPAPCSTGLCAGTGGIQPANAPAPTALSPGIGGCPSPLPKNNAPCSMYYPGYYSGGIQLKNQTAVFQPGLYYLSGGGFDNTSNGWIFPCQSLGGVTCNNPGETGDLGTGSGVLFYLHYDGSNQSTINLGANSNATLAGSDNASTYQGLLFFSDRSAPAQTHALGGGGNISLIGTIYLVNPLSVTKANTSQYQTLYFRGNPGSGTTIRGEIVTDAVSLGGNSSVTMNLDPNYKLPVDQVALVR